jgi:O-antigen ligase
MLIVASGWWLILFSSGTRGTLLGLIIAVPVTAWAFGRQGLPLLKWQAASATLGLVLYCLLFLLPPLLGGMDTSAIQEGTINRSLSHAHGRFYLWEVALGMVADNPLLGVGPMHYACGITNGIAAHPHNAILQLAAEWGLPVTAMVLCLWVIGIRAWIHQGRTIRNSETQFNIHPILYPALLASLVTASVHALFSGIIVMPLSQVIMILIISCMLAIYKQPTSSPAINSISGQSRLIWRLVIVFAIVGLLGGMLPDMILTNSLFNAEHLPTGTWHYMPRLWQQGLICG